MGMVGILVHGDNHFIVHGPLPEREFALALARHWSLMRIGATTPPLLDPWRIISREFRENLEWAVIVPGDGEIWPAVTVLLDELAARGLASTTPASGLGRTSETANPANKESGVRTNCRPTAGVREGFVAKFIEEAIQVNYD